MKKLTLFKRIDIDIEAERTRINSKGRYNKRQKLALNTLIDLFEKGEFQACLDFINDKKNFPYNTHRHYEEMEHIGTEISGILHDVAHNDYYTQEELLKQAGEKLYNEAKEKVVTKAKEVEVTVNLALEKVKAGIESGDWINEFKNYFGKGAVKRTSRK